MRSNRSGDIGAVKVPHIGNQNEFKQNQLISTSSSNSSTRFDFVCGTLFGYYRDPDNCAAYYICSFGIASKRNCSRGLYFSERLQTCDWSANVPCDKDCYVS
ncbi:Chitin binding Peritrophin-A domain containing protein 1 [Sarcoptes scabiei]|uniref:Chitin binding Peritrophin-A domain containing protein 1 n=1 Tax=Sarcoptes scabiei TaxID=52283 RepID=A0A131ZUB5_SARSC|nr:Chitin binding Peritrophin-A domain containing protein 1 [Sarcoptes scabiei]